MNLAILITTFNRRDILKETVDRLVENLNAPDNSNPIIFIADDGSEDGTQELVRGWQSAGMSVHLIENNRKGLGGNTNAGLRKAFEYADVVMQLQDDLWLDRELDLAPYIKALENPAYGWLKLGCFSEPPHKFKAVLEGHFWRVLWDSPELYIVSDKPHLKHKRFHEFFGFYPEGLKIGDTENSWCGNVLKQARVGGGPAVIVPCGIDDSYWRHVGDSWQGKGM